MNAQDLYADLDQTSKDQLENLAKEIGEKYSGGKRDGKYKGRVILFLGAAANYHAPEGFEESYSVDDRPPMASELTNKFIELLFEDARKREQKKLEHFPLSWITQYYEEVKSDRLSLVEQLANFVDGKKVSPILKALARMHFKYIITTNYDTLFEDALRNQGKAFEKGVYKPNKHGVTEYTPDPKDTVSVEHPFVYKLHGDIKEVFHEGDYLPKKDAIVITDDDYLHFIFRMSQNRDNKEKDKDSPDDSYYPIPETINQAFIGENQHTFLFIGYGLKDYNLRLILKTALWRRDSNILRAVRKWSIDVDPDPAIKQLWMNDFRLVFIEKNIWSAVPYLYKLLFGEEMPL